MRRRVLLDTGSTIRFSIQEDPLHGAVSAAVDRLSEAGDDLCFAPQSMREAWNVLTRPKEHGGYSLTVERAELFVAVTKAAFRLIEEGAEAFRQWERLVAEYRLVGKSVHDANLVAVALAHGATHILTLNERDFRRYQEIEVIVP